MKRKFTFSSLKVLLNILKIENFSQFLFFFHEKANYFLAVEKCYK